MTRLDEIRARAEKAFPTWPLIPSRHKDDIWTHPAISKENVVALLDVAEAAKVCVEQSSADNPFVGYGFEALRAALDRLENVAKL